MKNFNNTRIIGVDAGYGNMKTANFCCRTGIDTYETEPLFTRDMLTYNGKYYLIGEGHKNYAAEKTGDEDYYVLTLAAIAMKLSRENLTEADVRIAAGLPLAWVTEQKAAYRDYLLRNEEVRFSFRKKDYHVHIVGADVFPQGFAAIADKTSSLKGVTYLCDIGNGTMNLLCCRNGHPDSQKMYTEKYGTQQCINAVKDAVMNKYQVVMDEGIIEEYLKTGEADVSKEYLKIMKTAATQYVKDIFCRLQDHNYNAGLMRLYIVGGGGCLIRNFGKYDESRVTIDEENDMTAQEAREKYRLFVYGGGRIKENLPIDLSEYVKPADADEGTGYYVCAVPKKITVSKEIGNTVYDVTADFDTEGKQSLFQQFKKLILNSSQN